MEAVDDPYRILALNLVADLSDRELNKILHETKPIKRRIISEVNNADFYGSFLDCLMTELVKQNRDRQIHKHLIGVADFFYKELDIPRLRNNILLYCERFGRKVDMSDEDMLE